MPYRLSWYHENHVIYAAVSGNFTVAEFEAYGEELIGSYLDSATHPFTEKASPEAPTFRSGDAQAQGVVLFLLGM